MCQVETYLGAKPEWPEARALGVAVWLTNPTQGSYFWLMKSPNYHNCADCNDSSQSAYRKDGESTVPH